MNNIYDVIIIGSVMTYWYIGVKETVKSLKKIFNERMETWRKK